MDLNANGRKDIISGSWPGEIYLFSRRPNGTYGKPKPLKYADGSTIRVGSASAVAVADWDQDGDPDLLVGDIGGFVHLIVNSGTPKRPQFQKSKRLRAGGKMIRVSNGDAGPTVSDWDADGRQDLIVGTGSGEVMWFRNTQSGTDPKLEAGVSLIERPSSSPTSKDEFDNPSASGTRVKVTVTDWNGDGLLDLVVGDFNFRSEGETGKYHGWVWVYLRKSADESAGADLN